jgi:Flp pilus assembly protein TadG
MRLLANLHARLVSVIRRFRREERGTALTETAIMMPFLLILSAGVFEFGNVIYQKLLIEAGLRDGARYLARCDVTFNTSIPSCEDFARNIAACGGTEACTTTSSRVSGWGPGHIVIEYHVTDNPLDADGLPAYRGDATIRTVELRTTFNYTGTALLNFIGVPGINLGAAHQERYIGW